MENGLQSLGLLGVAQLMREALYGPSDIYKKMGIVNNMNACKVVVLLLVVTVLSSCGVNVDDPQALAEAGWHALIDGEYELLRTYVHPDDLEDWTDEKLERELSSLPPFPQDIEVILKYKGEKWTKAQARLQGYEAEISLELEYIDERWWIET